VLETLDAAAVHRWCGGGLEALRAHQHEIDELNVYPVPDGDTGTNLVLTLASAQQELEGSAAGEPSVEKGPVGALRRMARGALLGARGNSGVIVSQILRGMADSLTSSVAVRGAELARALRSASEAAYAAVARPVEGTVLSVVAAAADGAGRIKSDDLLAVARAAALAASEALARTPEQLPVLARAGVVDAGGRGLCLLLDALVAALTPAGAPAHHARSAASGAEAGGTGAGGAGAGGAGAHSARGNGAAGNGAEAGGGAGDADSMTGLSGAADEGGGFGYEVQYLLDAPEAAVDELRRVLDGLGDSLVVVGSGDGVWNVHVHVAAERIGPAVEAGVVAGRPHRISVTPLVPGRTHEPSAPSAPRRRGAVVVAAGDGLTALFEAEGATVVGRNPSIREMIDAIAQTRAGCVVLLPNDANTHAVATAAAREAEGSGVRVSVVPTRSPVQALAALAVRDTARPFSDDVIAMAEAAGACRYGEVCTAQRDSLTVAGPCRAGDLLGLVDGEVHVIGADLEDVSRRLLDRMLGGGGELTTLVLGADAPVTLEETLRGHVAQTWPFVELQCYAGGQPRYHLLVGVE
jgi:DAK2 domain fusion protein YloV